MSSPSILEVGEIYDTHGPAVSEHDVNATCSKQSHAYWYTPATKLKTSHSVRTKKKWLANTQHWVIVHRQGSLYRDHVPCRLAAHWIELIQITTTHPISDGAFTSARLNPHESSNLTQLIWKFYGWVQMSLMPTCARKRTKRIYDSLIRISIEQSRNAPHHLISSHPHRRWTSPRNPDEPNWTCPIIVILHLTKLSMVVYVLRILTLLNSQLTSVKCTKWSFTCWLYSY